MKVRHIVTWNFKEELSGSEKIVHGKKIKADLEMLTKVIDGIICLKVHVDLLSSSNRDILLDSIFESEEALKEYQAHPEHEKVGKYVGAVCKDRACVDYFEEEK